MSAILFNDGKTLKIDRATQKWDLTLKNVDHIEKIMINDYPARKYKIRVFGKDGATDVDYDSKQLRDLDFDEIQKYLRQTQKRIGEFNMKEAITEYFKKNEDAIITIVLIILADQIIFNGRFREKLISFVNALIDKISKKLEVN